MDRATRFPSREHRECARTRLAGVIIVGGIVVLPLVGCAPHISRFDAMPSTVCAGTPVEVAWKTNGVTKLSANPTVLGVTNGYVPKKGAINIASDHATILRMDVTRGYGSTSAEQEIRVRDAISPPKPIGRSIADVTMRCDASGISISDEIKSWDRRLRVTRVVSADGRQYHVEHDGLAGDVAPNLPSTTFSGAPIAGVWSLKTPLGAGEACGTGSLPRVLMVEVSTTCDSGSMP